MLNEKENYNNEGEKSSAVGSGNNRISVLRVGTLCYGI